MVTGEVPPWVRRCAVASVGLVATVAAIVSYAHMHTVAARAGEGWRAWLLPLSVDGLIVCASLVLIVRRRQGRPAGWLAWLGLVLGLAVSISANVAAAEPTLVGRLVAAWSPLALGVSYELLLGLLRPAPVSVSVVAVDDAVEPVSDDLVDRARAVVNSGNAEGKPVGRARLARALGIRPHQARQLLDQIRHDTTSPGVQAA